MRYGSNFGIRKMSSNNNILSKNNQNNNTTNRNKNQSLTQKNDFKSFSTLKIQQQSKNTGLLGSPGLIGSSDSIPLLSNNSRQIMNSVISSLNREFSSNNQNHKNLFDNNTLSFNEIQTHQDYLYSPLFWIQHRWISSTAYCSTPAAKRKTKKKSKSSTNSQQTEPIQFKIPTEKDLKAQKKLKNEINLKKKEISEIVAQLKTPKLKQKTRKQLIFSHIKLEIDLFNLYIKSKQVEDALNQSEKLLKIFSLFSEHSENDDLIIKAQLTIVQLRTTCGHHKYNLPVLLRLLNIFKKSPGEDSIEYLQTLSCLGIHYEASNKTLESAESLLSQAIELCEKKEKKQLKSFLLTYLSRVYLKQGKISTFIETRTKALDIDRETHKGFTQMLLVGSHFLAMGAALHRQRHGDAFDVLFNAFRVLVQIRTQAYEDFIDCVTMLAQDALYWKEIRTKSLAYDGQIEVNISSQYIKERLDIAYQALDDARMMIEAETTVAINVGRKLINEENEDSKKKNHVNDKKQQLNDNDNENESEKIVEDEETKESDDEIIQRMREQWHVPKYSTTDFDSMIFSLMGRINDVKNKYKRGYKYHVQAHWISMMHGSPYSQQFSLICFAQHMQERQEYLQASAYLTTALKMSGITPNDIPKLEDVQREIEMFSFYGSEETFLDENKNENENENKNDNDENVTENQNEQINTDNVDTQDSFLKTLKERRKQRRGKGSLLLASLFETLARNYEKTGKKEKALLLYARSVEEYLAMETEERRIHALQFTINDLNFEVKLE